MPVIVFIIDNSASMNQVTYMGTTYLDLAKGAVENFIKIRGRDSMSARNDRYMLLTLDEPPTNIKVGWKENMSIFNNELKNLKAHGITNLNPVLKQAFDLLNLNRLSSGMDSFGMGRCPFYLEPSIIILITDRSQLLNTSQTYDELNLPMTNAPAGSELTLEPFRWDQRFFLISLSMNAVPYAEPAQNTYIPVSQSPINSMCEVTGGRSYLISSQRMLFQCLESLVAKIQPGVVVNFEKFGPDPPALKANDEVMMMDRAWEKCKRMIFIPRNPATKGYIVGHWPLPEDYWLTLNSSIVPKRNAHPFIRFKCEPCEPLAIEDIPFDKYELEPSPLTQFMLERRQANVAWQCFIQNSGAKPNDFGYPFGYLKASSNMMTVCLIVLPYNYPALFQLMNNEDWPIICCSAIQMSRFLPFFIILLNLLVARSELNLICSNCLKQEPVEATESPIELTTTSTSTTLSSSSSTSTTPSTTTTTTSRRTTRTISSVVESCPSYYSGNDQPRLAINCTQQAPYCCGDCFARTCCADAKDRLNVSECVESCVLFSFTTVAVGSSLNSELFAGGKVQKCAKGQYCCGSCSQRQCCSNVTARLDQAQCDAASSSTKNQPQESYWWLFGLTGVFFIIFIILMLVGNYKKISLNRTRNLFITQSSEDDTQAMTSSRRNLIRVLTMSRHHSNPTNARAAHSAARNHTNSTNSAVMMDGPTPRNSLRSDPSSTYNSIYLSSMNNYQYPPSLPDYSNIYDPRTINQHHHHHQQQQQHMDDLPPAYEGLCNEANKRREVLGVKEESSL